MSSQAHRYKIVTKENTGNVYAKDGDFSVSVNTDTGICYVIWKGIVVEHYEVPYLKTDDESYRLAFSKRVLRDTLVQPRTDDRKYPDGYPLNKT